MGEQRSRRPGSQPPSSEAIDIAGSRGRSDTPTTTPTATPPPPHAKERHRKSYRRRNRKRCTVSSAATAEDSPAVQEDEESKCVNARVNPIFVWVRQEDTHIVDVKCEDYDKRNRIVLTKTAQGWRAIPRTETLVPNLRAAATGSATTAANKKIRKGHHHHHHHKVKRKSTAVQVDEMAQSESCTDPPGWNVPVNIESHLPSHTIEKKTDRATDDEDEEEEEEEDANVNTVAECSAQDVAEDRGARNKVCDVTPLDNLLAVAELEFNQQIETEAAAAAAAASWKDDDADMKSDDFKGEGDTTPGHFDSEEEKDDCDYNEDDENNMAMDDILNRLEQSLQSPDVVCLEIHDSQDTIVPKTEPEDDYCEIANSLDESDNQCENHSPVWIDDEEETPLEIEPEHDEIVKEEVDLKEEPRPEATSTVCTSTTATVVDKAPSEDKPTDLTTKKDKIQCLSIKLPDDDLMPTDLSLPKKKSPRPSSRSSETIQSPQPSGLPAVPHSPDVQKCGAYIESLLSSTSQKISLNSEVTITRQKEPEDFRKSRKSASPTVTCSEEVNSSSSPPKKQKLDDITLRAILDAKNEEAKSSAEKNGVKSKPETSSRLLELLTTESEPDALTQLKQLQADPNVNLPDPMLIPKDRLSLILTSPGKEIPKLVAARPELRLPEAFAFPSLLQDPDILVITVAQLETIIRKQTNSLSVPAEKAKQNQINSSSAVPAQKKAPPEQQQPEEKKAAQKKKEKDAEAAAANNALNQMMWLPYLQQLEVAALALGNSDFFKMLNSFQYPSPDLSMLRFPQPNFPQPLQQQPNPYAEFPLWDMTPPTRPDRNKNVYRDYMEKMKVQQHQHQQQSSQKYNKSPFPFPHPNAAVPNVHPFMPPYQHSMRPNLPVQYNPLLTQKPPYSSRAPEKPAAPSSSCDAKSFLYNNKANQRQHHQKGAGRRPPYGTLDCLPKTPQESVRRDFVQPMDLSGATTTSKSGGTRRSYDFGKSLKFDDVPEVGSTTASIEEMTQHMQESQKHLWHPLFGSQKSSSSPWNWSTVTATGE